jgi:hypothetical protein
MELGSAFHTMAVLDPVEAIDMLVRMTPLPVPFPLVEIIGLALPDKWFGRTP